MPERLGDPEGGLGGETVDDAAHRGVELHECVNTMGALYTLAMRETPPLIGGNPFSHLKLPPILQPPVAFYEHEEAELLYEAIEDRSGIKWRTAVELGMKVGLRPGEIFGLHGPQVAPLQHLVHVVHVHTRYGLKPYPKTKMSHRPVPMPDAVMAALVELLRGRDVWGECTCPQVLPDGSTRPGRGPCPSIVFGTEAGMPMDDGNFRDRIWNPAVRKAGIRRLPPKYMRHTAASWLVQDGVSLLEVQEVLGHEDPRTTQRYAHLAPGAHIGVRASWERRASSLG